MHFYNSTRGLIAITLLSVFSSTIAKPLGGPADGDVPAGCADTPGYDDGAVKQFFRGTRDVGDAALDAANGLEKKLT
jgi:hypothetical protein